MPQIRRYPLELRARAVLRVLELNDRGAVTRVRLSDLDPAINYYTEVRPSIARQLNELWNNTSDDQ